MKDLDLQISFQWYEVPYSDGYKLQVSKTDDFSAGNVVVAPTVYATSCLISNQFDYSTKYYWRTCGTNEAGDGPWSPVWAFTIKEDPTSVGDEYAKLFGSTVNPNPAGAGASLNFTLPQGYNVFVAIYDITGKETLAMPVQYMAEGSHSIAIDAQKLSTGTYWYVIKAGNQQEIGRFVVEK
ncbi:MAG: hypothetical protein QG635_1050 [Bacteroidota bacterium]|nr:hypothetical protein [Bacteroidota bacterium]